MRKLKLKDIKLKYPLSIDEEEDVIKHIKHFEEAGKIAQEEIKILISNIKQDPMSTIEKIVDSYEYLIISIARQYRNYDNIKLSELIEAGRNGLYKFYLAIIDQSAENIYERTQKFDVWFIRQGILQYISDQVDKEK